GQVWLEQVSCRGSERSLRECQSGRWTQHTCEGGAHAGVVCSDSLTPEPPHLRLANGSHRCAGRVELLHLARWGGVCAHGWSREASQVTCRYLGCGTALEPPGEADFGRAPGQVWLEQVSCRGSERSLRECQSGRWTQHTCEGGAHAGVVCS
ncbi:DMBT1 protein, partial [Sclerurus mexicanus]|nr:DMBT1 protein [Sclerurus mexicanus]